MKLDSLDFSETLAKCQYDDDCMKNAYCWNQETCLCKDNYIAYKNRTHVECLRGKIFKPSSCCLYNFVFIYQRNEENVR